MPGSAIGPCQGQGEREEDAAITVMAVAGEVRWAMVPASAAATPCMVSMPEECSPSA